MAGKAGIDAGNPEEGGRHEKENPEKVEKLNSRLTTKP
jgi:hypothetical protein